MKILPLFLCVVIIGLASPLHAADLTVNQLENTRYFIPSWEDPDQGEWVQLKNGEYSRRDPEKQLFVRVVEIALGHLAGQQGRAAAVVYWYNTGGSGFFTMLAAAVDNQGQPKFVAFTDLEDRVKINSLNIRSGKIVADMVVHGPEDPACCPTVKKIATYNLVGNKLVEK